MSDTKSYIVSARKYRPGTFQSVVGQRALTATLKNAISGGRLAQAYLFCGPRGVGKTSCARIFAKTINCLNPTPEGEACGVCESCVSIDKGISFNLVELDAASNNSVDNIRNITDQVNVPPQHGKYRVFIIDEVHMLSNSAFNAFLKTLEEPPKNVVFILATTERHKVIPTILSRCQIYDFRRITVNDIIDHLSFVAEQEGIEAEREALGVIALKADGAMRDALSIFDQVASSSHGKLTYAATIDALNVLDQEYYFRIMDIFLSGEVSEALLMLKEVNDKGFESQTFINGLASHIRNLMLAFDARTLPILETSEELAKRYAEQAPKFSADWYYKALEILNNCDFNYKQSSNKRLLAEIALIKLCRKVSGPFENPDAAAPQPRQEKTVKPEAKPSQEAPKKETVSPSLKPVTAAPPAPEVKPEKRGNVSRPSSFRISGVETAASSSQKNEGPRKREYSPREFSDAWNNYVSQHPEQRILVASMRGNLPELISDNEYRMEAEHPAQVQAYESALPDLLEHLRNSLENDFVRLRVELSKNAKKEEGLSSKDFLKLAVEDNAELAKFLKGIDAELEQ